LRAVESGVAGDFDLLAGVIMAGRAPLIVSGFYVLTTGITAAQDLSVQVADGSLIHFMASESGSVFHAPSDREDEQLTSTNPRVLGSFTPSQVNYVGLDLVREVDDTTVDLVEFIDTQSLQETPVSVPLARTLDYRIVISTLDFDNNPGIAPICKVTCDAGGSITLVEDARAHFFRLGSGGTIPNIQNAFPWPYGRKENTTGDVFSGGDKGISSFKEWMDGVMTRLWEVGGGEYWYSPATYANERLARTGVAFVSTGENFEWDGSHLHWKGLVWIFANSTSTFNVVADQTTDESGLTDLADGECIYVDVDRTQDLSGGSSLNAAKGVLSDLGTPEVPGSRYVIAWRYGSDIFTRDQSYFVGSAFKNATIAAAGAVLLSSSSADSSSPTAVATVDADTFEAKAAGLSRGYRSPQLTPDPWDFIGGDGDIEIGGGADGADGTGGGNVVDFNVKIHTLRAQDETIIDGISAFASDAAVLSIRNINTGNSFATTLVKFAGRGFTGPSVDDHIRIYLDGAVGFESIPFASAPATPTPVAGANIRSKFFFRDNGVVTPNTKDQLCVMGHDGAVTVIWESNPY